MKTKKILSLVLAMVMALALAIPAFAAEVAVGDVYTYDASGVTPAAGVNPGTDNSGTLTICGIAGAIADCSSTTTIQAQLAEWATSATAPSGWTISIDSDGTTVKFTATTAGATPPTGAQAPAAPPAPAGTTTISNLTDLETGATTNITTTTNVPTINVIIPQSGTATLNPYKLTVTLPDSKTSTDQIISATQFVESTSTVALKVSVKAVATPASGITMATKSITDKITDKQVYMYLNTAVLNDQASAPTTVAFPAFAKTSAAVLATGEGGLLSNVLLGAASTGKTSYLAFRLEGDMTPAPVEAWAATDTVGVALTFSFVAAAN